MKEKLRVGDWVEVLSKEEILATLDENAALDDMPLMPEMLSYCGQRFQVRKRAHKTCDTVFPVRGRRLEHAVHLETRCDGAAHGGCQAGCSIFWKEAWLRRVSDARADSHATHDAGARGASRCKENDVWAAAIVSQEGTETVYACQATRLPYATQSLEWWDIRQYVEDYTSGNTSLWRLLCGASYAAYYTLSQSGLGLGRVMRSFYDTFHRFWRGPKFPRKQGLIPVGTQTPVAHLNLQPGDRVRVKSHDAILRTINTHNMNRGMSFDAEQVPYCGGVYSVLKRVTTIINERTGKLQGLSTPCVILDSVVCQSRYSQCRMGCPRSIYSYWREIWLERVAPEEQKKL
jgi:hypothetical protein